MNDTCPECGDALSAYAVRCPCGWKRTTVEAVKTVRASGLEAQATEHVDPQALAKLKAHIRHGLGRGDQRRSIFRPDESYSEFLHALKESGKTRAEFEAERLRANGWTDDDEQRYQQRLRDLQLSYRYHRLGGHRK